MTLGQSEAEVRGAASEIEAAAAHKLMVDDNHTNAANTALGVSVGAIVGSLIGVSVLPGIAIAVAPVSAALIGGVVGNYAKRIATKLHSVD
jgi:uncharacterized protein YqgC (DUF456 family)